MNKLIKFLTITLIIQLILLGIVNAKRPEKFYQDMYCEGITEYVLPDRTRVDCLTDTTAGEFDFKHKTYEAIGQALYYGAMTGKKPKIYLIMDREKDKRYLERIELVKNYYNLDIEVEVIDKEDE